ncbi:MAG: T9SS type A sorting domain-containing protein [Chitinophagales bacterium]
MKKALLLTFIFSFLLSINSSFTQSFINGDFEDNSAVSCEYNLTDIQFNSKINNVVAFGKAYQGSYVGEVDFQTNNCYLDPQNGDWCLGLSTDTTQSSDALSIELTANLTAGNDYELTCYIYGNTAYRETLANVEIGESMIDTAFGQLIYTAIPDTNSWKEVKFVFTANQNSSHISVRTKIGIRGWTQIDNFSIRPATTTDIAEHNYVKLMKAYPNPTVSKVMVDLGKNINTGSIKILNLNGQVQSVHEINNNQFLSLDLSDLPTGIYFAQAIFDQQNETLLIHKQ